MRGVSLLSVPSSCTAVLSTHHPATQCEPLAARAVGNGMIESSETFPPAPADPEPNKDFLRARARGIGSPAVRIPRPRCRAGARAGAQSRASTSTSRSLSWATWRCRAYPTLRGIGDHLTPRGAVLDFDTLGAWRASGVAWVAPSVLPPVLVELHATLHGALVEAGFEMESRPFRPHVTLARRCVQPHPRSQATPIHWAVRRLCLIGSELRPEGPRHTTLAEWPLSL